MALLEPSESRMPRFYNFALKGLRAEPLGLVALPNDLEAVAFADRMIGEMKAAQDFREYAGCSMGISEDDRTVAIISFCA
jgi:hypothetical protein